MSNEPRIFEKNYVSADDTFVSSHGGTPANVYDRDVATTWLTSGANSDATTASLDVVFYEGTNAVNRYVDSMVLSNHNFKDWKLQTWNGSSWVDAVVVTGDTGNDTYRAFTGVTTAKVRLLCTATKVANQEKSCGELLVSGEIFQIGRGMNQYQVRPRQKVKVLTMGDNSMQQVVVKWTANRSSKYECTATFSLVTLAIWLAFQALKESGRAFTWYPEPEDDIGNTYQVLWTSTLTRKYSDNSYKAAGLEANLELKEI